MSKRTRYGIVALPLLIATTACSDDEPAATVVDSEPPEVLVTYPSASLGGTDADTIVMRGTATDPSGIDFITVNDIAVTTDDDFATWTVSLPLEEGDNEFRIARLDKAGNGITGSDRTITRLGEIWRTPNAVTGGAADTVYVADNTRGAIFEVIVSSGSRRIISGSGVGTGTDLIDIQSITFDGTRALIADAGLDAILAVDVGSGSRVVLSDLNTGSGPPLDQPRGIAWTSASNQVFVVDAALGAVLAVDLTTGDRSVLSDAVTGAGPALDSPAGLALDASNNRLLVTDTGSAPAVVAIDIATGDRSVVSSAVVGSGDPIGIPPSIVVDPTGTEAFVADISSGEVLRIDLSTGNRTRVSGFDLGEGPLISKGDSISYAPDGRVLVLDSVADALVGVDLTLGDRSYVSNVIDVGSGPRLVAASGMGPKWDAAVVVDASNGGVYKVYYGSGDREVHADGKTGSGPLLSGATDVMMDLDNYDSYVTDAALGAVVVVNYDTGDRTIVSDANVGSGAAFQNPTALALDIPNDRLFVADPPAGAIRTVVVSSGARNVLTDATTGMGPPLIEPIDVDYDYKADCLLALDGQSNDLFLIDANTGERHIVASCLNAPKQVFVYEKKAYVSSGSAIDVVDLDAGTCSPVASANLGSGPLALDIDGLTYNPERNSVFVNAKSLNAIVQIDVASGDRMIVAK